MDGGATALAPSDSQSTSLGLGKSKGSGKKKRLPLRLVRNAVRVCLDTVEFVRDRMTAQGHDKDNSKAQGHDNGYGQFTVYTGEAARYFIYLKRNLMPNI